MSLQDEGRQYKVDPNEENELFVLVPELLDFMDSIKDDHGQEGWNALETVRNYIHSNTLEQ